MNVLGRSLFVLLLRYDSGDFTSSCRKETTEIVNERNHCEAQPLDSSDHATVHEIAAFALPTPQQKKTNKIETINLL